MPLPLMANGGLIEFIALDRILYECARSFRLLIFDHGLSFLAHDGPAGAPVYRIQMHYTTVGFFILKMQEPVFTIFGMHPTSLMRAVDIGFSLSQYNFVLVRTIRRFRTHGQLKTSRHAASRTHNPVPPVALIELWSFAGAVLRAVAVEYDDRLSNGFCTVCRQFPHR